MLAHVICIFVTHVLPCLYALFGEIKCIYLFIIFQRAGGRSESIQEPSKKAVWNSNLLDIHLGSPVVLASTVILLLPKATFTPSIHPNLGLPPYLLPLTSTIQQHPSSHTVLINLSTCPNHLDICWSTLLASCLSLSALRGTSSFPTLFIRDTHTKFFISRIFTFLLSALLIPLASVLCKAVGTVQVLLHIDTFSHSQFSIAQYTFHVSPCFSPLIHFVSLHCPLIHTNNSWFMSNLPPAACKSSSSFPSTLPFTSRTKPSICIH